MIKFLLGSPFKKNDFSKEAEETFYDLQIVDKDPPPSPWSIKPISEILSDKKIFKGEGSLPDEISEDGGDKIEHPIFDTYANPINKSHDSNIDVIESQFKGISVKHFKYKFDKKKNILDKTSANNEKISFSPEPEFEHISEERKFNLHSRSKSTQGNTSNTRRMLSSNIKLISQNQKREKMHNVLNSKVNKILDPPKISHVLDIRKENFNSLRNNKNPLLVPKNQYYDKKTFRPEIVEEIVNEISKEKRNSSGVSLFSNGNQLADQMPSSTNKQSVEIQADFDKLQSTIESNIFKIPLFVPVEEPAQSTAWRDSVASYIRHKITESTWVKNLKVSKFK